MKKHAVAALFLIPLISMPAAAAPQPPNAYSAVMTGRSAEGEYRAKMFVSGRKTRIEMEQTSMIVRLDLNVTYVLMPQEKMYMEQQVDTRLAAQSGGEMPGEIERKPMGREAVNGVSAEKFLVRYASPDGGEQAVVQWIGDGGMPVKTAAVDGSWSVEFSEVKIGPQPESLFEPPADYERFAMPNMADFANAAR